MVSTLRGSKVFFILPLAILDAKDLVTQMVDVHVLQHGISETIFPQKDWVLFVET